jgi:hypothetical protein
VPNTFHFKELLEDLKGKIAYREMTSILKKEELGSAMGWDKLEERLNGSEPALAAKAEKLLKSLQEGLTIAGTKDVYIFEIDRARAKSLGDSFAAIPVSPGNYSTAYPRALSETALKQLTSEHELVQKITRTNGDVTLVFCAKRAKEERVVYELSQVGEAVQTAFVGYDEFIAIKRTDYQVFDVLTLRKSLARIEVLVDHPDLIRGAETNELRCLSILGRMTTLIPELSDIYEQNLPLNLNGCISGLYADANQGRVSKLSFRTPTKSVNRGAMTSNDDLRKEDFHEAGVAKVGKITPYDVTIVWDTIAGVQGSVGVQVSMPIVGLSFEDFHVRQARIIGAQSDVAVVAVVNKLVSFST